MCLTIPKKVISVNENSSFILKVPGDKKQRVKSILKVKKGDWVLTQGGVIVSKITSRQAKEINKLIFNK